MWKQLGRERLRGARCRVRPLMRDMGLAASRTKSVASEDETPPADNPPREDIDDDRGIHESAPRSDVREI